MTFRSLGFFASSGARAKPGMVLLTPTSIAHSGTSASIGANGQVTFTAVTSLSLNGVFSATYDNYVMNFRCSVASGLIDLNFRYRTAGTDDSGNNYTRQFLDATGTTVSAGRTSSANVGRVGAVDAAQRNGYEWQIYGPFLAQPTASRGFGASSYTNAYIAEFAVTHSLSTSYDGFTLLPSASSITGALQVYGVRG